MRIWSGYKLGTTASPDLELSHDPFRRRPTIRSPRRGASAVMDKRRRCGAERILASPAGFVGGCGGGDLPDLSEDDVWATFFSSAHSASEIDDDDNDRWPGTNLAGDRRWTGRHVGGLSLAFKEPYRGPTAPPRREKRIAVAASAPMDVPAWPRHLRAGSGGPPPDPEVEEEDDAGEEWLPPHEYLAMAHGRSAATASVLEGAGRTLKGRDMSRVRDAVWSQTGFFG